MNVQQRPLDNGWWLVTVSGRLDQHLLPDLDVRLGELIGAGHVRLLVDFSMVDYINSGGLRSLVTAWRRARAADGDLRLVGLTERLREIFDMVGFDKIFTIYASLAEALDAVNAVL